MAAHQRTFRIAFLLLVPWACVVAASAAQTAQKPTPPVFGADVALVAMPVFVTDKSGKAVPGLTAQDFEVEDGGKKVPIVAFQAIDVNAPVTAASQAQAAGLPVAVQAEGPRQFLLLIDLEFSPPVGVLRGRGAAASFIREGLAPGDLVAVATWGRSGLRVLTNFTEDHENAARALEGKGVLNNPGLDPLGLAGGFGTLAPSGARSDEMAAEMDAVLAQALKEEYATRVAAFLESVSDLVRRLGSLRGRKQLVLLSGGFRESAWNAGVSQTGRGESVPNIERMQKIFREAGHGDVVMHAVSLVGIAGSLDLSSRTARSDSRTIDGSVDLRTGVDLASGRSTLTTMATNTGGHFIQPTNDFSRALREVDRVSRQSYVIAFEAAEAAAPGDKPRTLKVRVRRPGLSVSHRASYAAPPVVRSTEGAGRGRLEAAEAIAKGLTGGSLPLHVTTLPYRDRDGRTVVHAVLRIDGSAFSESAGKPSADVEVYGYLMEEGRVLDSLAATTSLDLARFGNAIRASGLHMLSAFPVSPGAADLRFFVRTGSAGETGSIRQALIVPTFVEGETVLSAPMFNVSLSGRVAVPFQSKDRPRIEIPFRLGSEAFVPETPVALKPGIARQATVFVWPSRPASKFSLEVTGEIAKAGETSRALGIEGAPRVVRDPDGFDRYVVSVVPPAAPPGSYSLRLMFRDPETGRTILSETGVTLDPPD